MKKITAFIISVLLIFSYFNILSFADDFVLELDPSERYTDISFVGDEEEYNEFFGIGISKNAKAVYISVLSVLLVISVTVLVVTLKKARKETVEYKEEIKEADNEEIKKILSEYKKTKALRDELENEKDDT